MKAFSMLLSTLVIFGTIQSEAKSGRTQKLYHCTKTWTNGLDTEPLVLEDNRMESSVDFYSTSSVETLLEIGKDTMNFAFPGEVYRAGVSSNNADAAISFTIKCELKR